MIPHDTGKLVAAARAQGLRNMLRPVDRVSSGFYISQAMEVRL